MSCPLLERVPPELRLKIYGYVFNVSAWQHLANRVNEKDPRVAYKEYLMESTGYSLPFPPFHVCSRVGALWSRCNWDLPKHRSAILMTCRQIYGEAIDVLLNGTLFHLLPDLEWPNGFTRCENIRFLRKARYLLVDYTVHSPWELQSLTKPPCRGSDVRSDIPENSARNQPEQIVMEPFSRWPDLISDERTGVTLGRFLALAADGNPQREWEAQRSHFDTETFTLSLKGQISEHFRSTCFEMRVKSFRVLGIDGEFMSREQIYQLRPWKNLPNGRIECGDEPAERKYWCLLMDPESFACNLEFDSKDHLMSHKMVQHNFSRYSLHVPVAFMLNSSGKMVSLIA